MPEATKNGKRFRLSNDTYVPNIHKRRFTHGESKERKEHFLFDIITAWVRMLAYITTFVINVCRIIKAVKKVINKKMNNRTR